MGLEIAVEVMIPSFFGFLIGAQLENTNERPHATVIVAFFNLFLNEEI
jgi:hypothetical protein